MSDKTTPTPMPYITTKVKGAVSRGIKSAYIDEGKNLIFVLTDNSEINVGNISAEASAINNAQINALDGMFRKCVFTGDVSAEYSAFRKAFETTTEEPDEPIEPDTPIDPDVTLTSISATYSGGEVTSGTDVNTLTDITVTATYSNGTTATVNGYTLSGEILEGENPITVSYGGKTTTFIVMGVAESGGDSSAELITDGLLGYWDFRNPEEVVTQNWHWAYPSNEGTGGLYAAFGGGSLGTASLPTFDSNYGVKTGCHITSGASTFPSEANDISMGEEHTVIMFSRGASNASELKGLLGVIGSNISPRWEFFATYNTSNGTANTGGQGTGNGDITTDYNFLVKRVNGAELTVIMDTSVKVYDGSTYNDFVSWYDKMPSVYTLNGDGTTIAVAIYNRALTDIEIEEMRAFMKTLEVA